MTEKNIKNYILICGAATVLLIAMKQYEIYEMTWIAALFPLWFSVISLSVAGGMAVLMELIIPENKAKSK